MLIEFLICSIIIGMIRGGNVVELVSTTFNKIIVLILSLLIYMSFFHFLLRGYEIVLNNIQMLHTAIYIILLIALVLNYKFREVWVIFIGASLNLLSFLANNQSIVFSEKGLDYINLKDAVNIFVGEGINLITPLTETTKATLLSRFIAIPHPYPYPQIFSIGDLLMSLGIFLIIQNIMFSQDISKNSMIRFKYRGNY